jgi:RNA polymerase sigma-70 factor (ECF subfamily)
MSATILTVRPCLPVVNRPALRPRGTDIGAPARRRASEILGRRSVAAVPNDAVDRLAGGDGTPAEVGNAEARMRRIHEAHAGPLFRFLLRLTLGNHDLSEDLLQETLLRAWRNIDVLPAEADRVRAWLHTVARNVAIDAARARKARPPEVSIPDLTRLSSEGDAADRIVTVRAVRDAMTQLAPAHRAVLVELYFKSASTAEAAIRLGIPEGTVKSRAYYAVRSLQTVLGSVDAA